MAMSLGQQTLSPPTTRFACTPRCRDGSGSAPQGTAKDAGMTSYLRPQQQSEQRDGQPRPQVRPDPDNQPGIVEFEHHRIGDGDTRDPGIADGHPGRTLADD